MKLKIAIAVALSPLLAAIALGLAYAVWLVWFMIWWAPYEVLRDVKW